jgi:microcystin-dependent protein
MADPFVAEIRIFPFNFAPKGWAFCDGQLLPLSQNTALFALVGTTYGGDGKSTFALPDLRGRAPMHPGQGQGLSPRVLGETGGRETATLSESEMPAHAHSMMAQSALATSKTPAGNSLARANKGHAFAPASANVVAMASQVLASAGGQAPHNNMMPSLTMSFCIALQGVFPPRS